jgi:hypothetical protein
MRRVDGGSLFQTFDGATMQSYLYPGKADEIVFCRQHPESRPCLEGYGLEIERANLPLSSLQVKAKTHLGAKVGVGVIATRDIPHQSYVGLEKLIHSIRVPAKSYELLKGGYKHNSWWGESLKGFIDEYGHYSRTGVS